MSGGPKPTFLMPVYDAQELRRRMAVAFTIGELYRFAEKLQVPATPAWSNNPQEAARDIVRHFERSGALPFLVEALQEAKPLVAWPEPALPPQPPPSAPQAAPLPGAPPAGPTVLGEPDAAVFDDAPTTADPPGDRPTPISSISAAAVFAASRGNSNPPAASPGAAPAPAIPAGFAPAIMPRPGEAPAAPASAPGAPPPSSSAPERDVGQSRSRTEVDSDLAAFMAAGSGAAARPASAGPTSSAAPVSGPAWPGTVRAAGPPPAKAPPDYRILAGGGAALLLVAVAVAFFVGRASSASPAESGESATSATASAKPAGDHAAISQHVVDALGVSLARVARDCQIDLGTLRGRPLFEVAYRRCGPLPPQAVAPQRPTYNSYDPADPNTDPPPADAQPDPPKKGGTAGGKKLQKVDTPSGPGATGGSGCLSRCSQSHGACTSRCGAEPKQGSQYDAYQACLGGCLKALSQCKMGCQ